MSSVDDRTTLRSNTLDRVSEAVVSLNTDLEYTFVNPQAEELLESNEENLLGSNILEAFPEVVDSVTETKVREALKTGREQTFERYNKKLDRWFEVRTYPDDHGVSLFFTDISDRKEREAELKQYEQLIEALPVAAGMNTLGEEGTFEFVNQAAVEMFDAASKAELQAYSPRDTYANKEERKAFSNQLQNAGSLQNYEIQLQTLQGESFLASVTAKVAEIQGTEYIIGIMEDISEQKAKHAELRYKTKAIDDAPIGMTISDYTKDDNPLVYANKRFEEMTGYAAEEVSGRNCRFLQDEKTAEKPVTKLRNAVEAGEAATVELRNYRKGGEVFWNRLSIAPVTTEEGHTHFVGFQQDVTEEKERALELERINDQISAQNTALGSFADIVSNSHRSHQEQIRDLLDLATSYLRLDIGILSFIEDSEYTVKNVVSSEDNIEPGDVFSLTDTYCSAVYDADGPVAFRGSEKADIKDHPAYGAQKMRSYIGVPVWVDGERYGTLNFSSGEYREEPIRDGEKSFVRILAQWIGAAIERQHRQEELERTREFLKQTQEVARVGGCEVDLRTDELRWSKQVYRIHGLSMDETPSIAERINFYHPDDRDTLRDAFNRLTFEGEPYDLELRIVTPEDEIRWVRTRGEPRYEDGELVRIRGTLQDITERKEREQALKKQNDRLDEFAEVISHDLRNPLTIAMGRSEILAQSLDEEYEDHLRPLISALDRMEAIIGDTLTLARQGDTVGEMHPIHLGKIVRNCWEGVATEQASLEIADEIIIHGDNDRLRHVFENLFRNAVEHAGKGVTVKVGYTGHDCLYVEDNGGGIPPNKREVVLEAGHTSASGGTGFGLSIVNRIAEAHGWDVNVSESETGGARFEFTGVTIEKADQ